MEDNNINIAVFHVEGNSIGYAYIGDEFNFIRSMFPFLRFYLIKAAALESLSGSVRLSRESLNVEASLYKSLCFLNEQAKEIFEKNKEEKAAKEIVRAMANRLVDGILETQK